MNSPLTTLVTGGAGFIGSNFVRHLLRCDPSRRVVVLDALTYAGHRRTLADVQDNPRFAFVHGDITDVETVRAVFSDGPFGDGVDEVVRSYDTTVLTTAAGDTNLAGVADLRTADIDGDGRLDVIGWDPEVRVLLALRNAGSTLAPPVGLHTDRDLTAVAGLADMTGDGVPELVFVDVDGRTVHSAATEPATGAAW